MIDKIVSLQMRGRWSDLGETISEHHPEVSLSKIDPTANSHPSTLSKQLDQFNAAYSICLSIQYSIYIYYIGHGTVGIFSYNHFPNPAISLWEFVHNKAHRVRVPKCRSHKVCEISCWSPPWSSLISPFKVVLPSETALQHHPLK